MRKADVEAQLAAADDFQQGAALGIVRRVLIGLAEEVDALRERVEELEAENGGEA